MNGSKAKNDSVIMGVSQFVQDYYDYCRESEPKIFSTINSVAQETNGHLEGIEFSVKTASSISEKLATKTNVEGVIYSDIDAIKTFSDIIRYTEILPDSILAEKVPEIIEGLENRGFLVVEIDNKFEHSLENEYKGLHMEIISPEGIPVEFQVHTPESYEAKMEAHAYYEIVRDTTGKYTMEEKMEALQSMAELFSQVPDLPYKEDIIERFIGKDDLNEVCRMVQIDACLKDIVADISNDEEKIIEKLEEKISNEGNLAKQEILINTKEYIENKEKDPVIKETNDWIKEISSEQIEKYMENSECFKNSPEGLVEMIKIKITCENYKENMEIERESVAKEDVEKEEDENHDLDIQEEDEDSQIDYGDDSESFWENDIDSYQDDPIG